MKLTAIISLLAMILLGSTATALAQEKSCSFDLVGTWKAQVSSTEARLCQFDDKGVVTVLTATGTESPQQIATAKYEVIKELGKPDSVSFLATGENGIFGAVKKAMNLVSYRLSRKLRKQARA